MRQLFFVAFLLLNAIPAFSQSDPIVTENYTESDVRSTSDSTTTVISPPPSAISPTINTANSDLCTFGVAGAVQTQILGISAGSTIRDMNCEKLKNAKTLYDMGMKVAAVSVMCQDPRVFAAMMNAGTPCPFDGMIGQQARDAWSNPENAALRPDAKSPAAIPLGNMNEETTSTLIGGSVVAALMFFLLR